MPKRNPATAERGPLGAAEPRRKRKKLQTSFSPMPTVAKLSSVLYPAQHPGPVAPSRAIKGRTAAKKMLQQQCKTIGCKHCSWTGRSGLGYEKHRHHSDIPGILWLAPRGIFPPTGLQGATSTFTSDSSSSPES